LQEAPLKSGIVIATAVAAGLMLAPAAASAHERIGDAALGAAAGALVAGPIGLVAGGAIGYAAGPHISRHIFHGHRHHRHYRHDRHRDYR
jgi:hypothetical protein